MILLVPVGLDSRNVIR